MRLLFFLGGQRICEIGAGASNGLGQLTAIFLNHFLSSALSPSYSRSQSLANLMSISDTASSIVAAAVNAFAMKQDPSAVLGQPATVL